jgi:ABC-type bacteriocin/lantibiotic exporter with double-glycine peptidase domain
MKRRFFAPEVIQIGATDCGPAVLKCLASAWGLTLDLERVRQACQTTIDGTSLESIEDTLNAVGIPVRQFMIPQRAFYAVAAAHAPFILTVRSTGDAPHFIVVWSAARGRVQIMDPAIGRVWVTAKELANRIYSMSQPVTQRQMSAQTVFFEYLRERMRALRLPSAWEQKLDGARASRSVNQIMAFYAIVEELDEWTRAGLLQRGAQAARAMESAFANWDTYKPTWRDPAARRRLKAYQLRDGSHSAEDVASWSEPFSLEQPFIFYESNGQLTLSGAVILGVAHGTSGGGKPSSLEGAFSKVARGAIIRKEPSVFSYAASVVAKDKSALFGVLLLHIPLVLLVTIGEVFLFRAALSSSSLFGTGMQRLGAVTGYVIFLAVVFLLELVVIHGLAQIGRRAEVGTHVDVLTRFARLPDSFFRTRPLSDLAHRTYSATQLRSLPGTAVGVVRGALELLVVVTAVFFLDTRVGAFLALSISVLAVTLYFAGIWFSTTQRKKLEHSSGLLQFYLDGLLAQVPIHTHGAASCLRVEFEEKLANWYQSGRELTRRTAAIGAVTQVLFVMATIGTVAAAITGSVPPESILLLLLWTQRIPPALITLTGQLRLLPIQSHAARRLTEPLRVSGASVSPPELVEEVRGPVQIEFQDVAVDVVGHRILDGINLTVGAGEHVAIVGASGSGKSTLMQTLLGIYDVAAGAILIDRKPPTEERIAALRRVTAWVDPTVQLSRRTLVDNVYYGNERRQTRALDEAADLSDLKSVLEFLPGGYQRNLGEGGRLLSGGEAQRVRLARALLASDTRLVLLDEAFRGLERTKRQILLQQARITWAQATLFCVTHDITLTTSFPRVVVMQDGRVMEDGVPADLMSRDTIYAKMLAQETAARHEVWTNVTWGTLTVERGEVTRVR